MASIEGYAQDILTRIVNVKWGLNVYVIIAATRNDFATTKLESVKILETRSVSLGGGAEPISGTLIGCSAGAGDAFVTLRPTSSNNPEGLQFIRVFVCPKTDEVKANWFDYVMSIYDSAFQDANLNPKGPFLWISRTYSGTPNVMNFKIRRTAHLIKPPDGAVDMMVQAYPTSGDNTWSAGGGLTVISGFDVQAYRLDKKGVGTTYTSQRLWATHPYYTVDGEAFLFGIKFGNDPVKIPVDTPWPVFRGNDAGSILSAANAGL